VSAQCKTCKVPMFKRADGAYAADSRDAKAPAFTGTDRRRAAPPPPETEPPPVRFHFLNRPIFGGHKQQGA
jgi:hypothetical protein